MTSPNRFSTDMTEWFPPSAVPLLVGEYNASINRVDWMRRWWDGTAWSAYYSAGQPVPKTIACDEDQAQIWWRGLAKDPATPERRPKLMWTQLGSGNGTY